MIPETLWDRIVRALWWPWRKLQCCAELPYPGGGCSYCVRRKGHFGQHRTYNGTTFQEAGK